MRKDKGKGKGNVDKGEAKGKGERFTGWEPGDICVACIGFQKPRDSTLAFRIGNHCRVELRYFAAEYYYVRTKPLTKHLVVD